MTTLHATNCVVCTKRPPEWGLVCAPCTSRMRDQLRDLVEEYALLDATPGSSTGQRVSGTRTAPLPVRLDVLSLVGPGSANVHVDRRDEHDDQIGELPTATWLLQWVIDWRDYRGQTEELPGLSITAMTRWLEHRLDWAADEHPAVDDFASELAAQVRALRGVNRAGEPSDRSKVGPCPQQLADGDTCRTTLYMHDRIDFITCGGCGAEWQRRNWPWLFRTVAAVGERTA